MGKYYYTVQFEIDGGIITCETPQDVYDCLKSKKQISILKHNDSKTGKAFSKAAVREGLTESEQIRKPLFISTALSDEGVFVESEEFWVENYMFGEFYNPDQMPYIEKCIKR